MPAPETKTERNARLIELRNAGWSYNKIAFQLTQEGFEYVSPQRIAEIVKREQERAEK